MHITPSFPSLFLFSVPTPPFLLHEAKRNKAQLYIFSLFTLYRCSTIFRGRSGGRHDFIYFLFLQVLKMGGFDDGWVGWMERYMDMEAKHWEVDRRQCLVQRLDMKVTYFMGLLIVITDKTDRWTNRLSYRKF